MVLITKVFLVYGFPQQTKLLFLLHSSLQQKHQCADENRIDLLDTEMAQSLGRCTRGYSVSSSYSGFPPPPFLSLGLMKVNSLWKPETARGNAPVKSRGCEDLLGGGMYLARFSVAVTCVGSSQICLRFWSPPAFCPRQCESCWWCCNESKHCSVLWLHHAPFLCPCIQLTGHSSAASLQLLLCMRWCNGHTPLQP